MKRTRSFSSLVLWAALFIAACSSSTSPSPSGSSDAGDAGDAGGGGTPPGQPRSLRADVIPIFAKSCSTKDCHGDPNTEEVRIHLDATNPDGLYAQLQLESPTAKGAKLVVPGDPAKSFLFAKVNGDADNFSAACVVPGCGETMPPGSKIPSVQRDTIQQWITEGAPNN